MEPNLQLAYIVKCFAWFLVFLVLLGVIVGLFDEIEVEAENLVLRQFSKNYEDI